ncbi:MAG TPA: nucleoside triphosphate pyrophosphohydrolase [Nevskiaceae bacterium]|nr:nucleoside triphosphate pyrophosphohydrolase [Nevskiaceae bacterium]
MTKKRYYHRKLIRDRIPEFIEANKGEYETRILGEIEFEKELKKKLVEESKELVDAPKKSLLNELADVLELVKSIASHYKLSFRQVEEYQKQKRKKRGGFKKRLFLIWSTGKSGK